MKISRISLNKETVTFPDDSNSNRDIMRHVVALFGNQPALLRRFLESHPPILQRLDTKELMLVGRRYAYDALVLYATESMEIFVAILENEAEAAEYRKMLELEEQILLSAKPAIKAMPQAKPRKRALKAAAEV